MIKNGKGGANTNKNGLKFESKADIRKTLESNGFTLVESKLGKGIYETEVNDEKIIVLQKQKLYRYLGSVVEDYDSSDYVSKQLWPDNCFINPAAKRIVIIEVKYQSVGGSVDEKLQTCDFKKKQYEKIASPLGFSVEYIYILAEWFNNPKYIDVLAYIEEKGCKYYFNELPIEEITGKHKEA